MPSNRRKDELIRARVERFFREWLSYFEHVVCEAKEQGIVPATLDTSTTAQALLAYFRRYWRVTFDNPPINLFDPDIFAALRLLLDRIETDEHVRVLVFDAADPDELIRNGLIRGGLLGIGFLCVALSLRNIGIIPAAMLTALDGIIAAGISWASLRQRQSLYTCLAALCAGLFWWIAPGRWQADIAALCCGIVFTSYALYVERSGVTHKPIRQLWPFFGGLFSAMAVVTLTLALCFGGWWSLQTVSLTDLGILLLFLSSMPCAFICDCGWHRGSLAS